MLIIVTESISVIKFIRGILFWGGEMVTHNPYFYIWTSMHDGGDAADRSVLHLAKIFWK